MVAVVRSLPVHYEERGSGTPILMLHGWDADHRYMLAAMEPLFAERDGWRRIYPDLPGMGRTPGADWIAHQDHVLDVVAGFLDVLVPGQRFVVVGTSYGGYIALGLVHRLASMVDGIALIVPAVEFENDRRQLPRKQVLVEDAAFLAALRPEESHLADIFVVQSREALEAFRTYLEPAGVSADEVFLERLSQGNAFSFDVHSLEDPFEAPTLLLTGRQDSVCGYQDAWAIVENFPRATFAVLDRAGHGLGAEQPLLFQALMGEWLERVREHMDRPSS